MAVKFDTGKFPVVWRRILRARTEFGCIWALLFSALAVFFLTTRATAAETYQIQGKNVLMLELADVTVNSPQLFMAIRAQLAASMSDIHQVELQASEFNLSNPLQDAAALADEHESQMVFWVQIRDDLCTISFYFAEDVARLYVRRLHLTADNTATRYEVIANAVSSLIEETVFSLREDQNGSRSLSASTAQQRPPRSKVVRTSRGVELRALYRVAVFSRSKLMHGIEFGLGIIANQHLVVGLGYTHGFAAEWQADSYRFSITSKYVNAAITGRLYAGATEIRVGLAYITEIRTLSTSSRTEEITPRRLDTNAIFGIMPSVDAIWRITGKFSMATGLGASIAFNERGYLISRDDGTTYFVTDPYSVKFVFRVGFHFQL
jgi:hypothetical protein